MSLFCGNFEILYLREIELYSVSHVKQSRIYHNIHCTHVTCVGVEYYVLIAEYTNLEFQIKY